MYHTNIVKKRRAQRAERADQNIGRGHPGKIEKLQNPTRAIKISVDLNGT